VAAPSSSRSVPSFSCLHRRRTRVVITTAAKTIEKASATLATAEPAAMGMVFVFLLEEEEEAAGLEGAGGGSVSIIGGGGEGTRLLVPRLLTFSSTWSMQSA
jgi:hypothetical protein